MPVKVNNVIIIAALMIAFTATAFSEELRFLLQEDFDNIDNWRSLKFPKIKEYSTYTVVEASEGNYLKAESDASASALIYGDEFSIYEFPYIKWRWKVENVYGKGNARSKKGDDYPIRIYVIFKYDPNKAGFRERIKYRAAKLLHGEYPPHSGLNYIWANREHKEKIITNKYTDKVKLILSQKGSINIGKWQEHEANVIDDYREAFGKNPPEMASIAIMNDSDNTKESSVSYIDYIEIFGKQ